MISDGRSICYSRNQRESHSHRRFAYGRAHDGQVYFEVHFSLRNECKDSFWNQAPSASRDPSFSICSHQSGIWCTDWVYCWQNSSCRLQTKTIHSKVRPTRKVNESYFRTLSIHSVLLLSWDTFRSLYQGKKLALETHVRRKLVVNAHEDNWHN